MFLSIPLTCSIFPCTRVLSCPYPRISLSIPSFFSLPLSHVFNSPRVFYIPLPPLPFFDIPAAGPTIFVPLAFPHWHLPSSFLSQNLSFSLCVYIYIYYTFFIQSSSYLPVSHKFNPTSLRLAPYTFHCSIKRPTRIYTRVYTMNSVVVVVVVQKAAEKANRIRVGHDTS